MYLMRGVDSETVIHEARVMSDKEVLVTRGVTKCTI